MSKKYEYNGFVYCEDDLSEEIYNYGGNLCDLYYELARNGKVEGISPYYFVRDNSGDSECYEDCEDLIKAEYENLGVEVLQGYE